MTGLREKLRQVTAAASTTSATRRGGRAADVVDGPAVLPGRTAHAGDASPTTQMHPRHLSRPTDGRGVRPPSPPPPRVCGLRRLGPADDHQGRRGGLRNWGSPPPPTSHPHQRAEGRRPRTERDRMTTVPTRGLTWKRAGR